MSDSLQVIHNELLALQHALQSSGAGFIRIAADDTLVADESSLSLLGLKNGDALDDLPDLLMCMDESQQENLLDQFNDARDHNKEVELELRLEKQPHAAPILFSGQAVKLPGEPGMSICGILREAPESTNSSPSQSESASAALLEEAQRANAELANFASIASHDMREPLRMITSYLRLLQERSPEALDDRARRYIDYACEGADRMRQVIDDLLSYARLDKAGKAFEPLALEDVLATAIDNLHANIRDTKAEVTIEIDSAPIIVGDKVRLTRLFQNLIANGIKFKHPEQIARVHISFKDGERSGAPGQWIVCIRDHGIGIDPDHHDMLFGLFQRLNTREEFDGSGIGLAVCKKIAEQHQGRIWFDSVKGKGSTFYVALKKADVASLHQ